MAIKNGLFFVSPSPNLANFCSHFESIIFHSFFHCFIMPSHSVPFFLLFLFFMFFAAFLPPFADSQQNGAAPCAPSGFWGDWTNWSSCVPNLNIQRRIRPCNAQPAGCTASKPYNCSGSYSEVRPCGDDGGWNAQMLQSLSINRQYPGGAMPPGASFSAGMVQAMNINNTNG